MVELAVETGIPIREWRDESSAFIATALDVIADRAEQMRNR
jgi:hypothetical protein